MPQAQPRYLKRSAIDVRKWDHCIDTATNGLVYAYSYYLDIMARHWDALVWGDYEWVMPLTWNQQWGVSYLYQPPFTAMLGVFGKNPDSDRVQFFLEHLPEKFKLVEIDLNTGNRLNSLSEGMILRTNYQLSLNRDYSEIRQGYRENIRRNVKKAIELGCDFRSGVPLDNLLPLARLQSNKRGEPPGDSLHRFEQVYTLLREKKQAESYGVFSPSGELLAGAVFFFALQRAIYILVGNHPNSRVFGASHFLLDQFIQQHAGQPLMLDFEGSDIRNLAFFYSSFGACAETYPALRINRLPWWIRWMK